MLVEEDESEVSTTTSEASIEEEEDTTRPSENLGRQRRRYVYGIRVLSMTAAASAK